MNFVHSFAQLPESCPKLILAQTLFVPLLARQGLVLVDHLINFIQEARKPSSCPAYMHGRRSRLPCMALPLNVNLALL